MAAVPLGYNPSESLLPAGQGELVAMRGGGMVGGAGNGKGDSGNMPDTAALPVPLSPPPELEEGVPNVPAAPLYEFLENPIPLVLYGNLLGDIGGVDVRADSKVLTKRLLGTIASKIVKKAGDITIRVYTSGTGGRPSWLNDNSNSNEEGPGGGGGGGANPLGAPVAAATPAPASSSEEAVPAPAPAPAPAPGASGATSVYSATDAPAPAAAAAAAAAAPSEGSTGNGGAMLAEMAAAAAAGADPSKMPRRRTYALGRPINTVAEEARRRANKIRNKTGRTRNTNAELARLRAEEIKGISPTTGTGTETAISRSVLGASDRKIGVPPVMKGLSGGTRTRRQLRRARGTRKA